MSRGCTKGEPNHIEKRILLQGFFYVSDGGARPFARGVKCNEFKCDSLTWPEECGLMCHANEKDVYGAETCILDLVKEQPAGIVAMQTGFGPRA